MGKKRSSKSGGLWSLTGPRHPLKMDCEKRDMGGTAIKLNWLGEKQNPTPGGGGKKGFEHGIPFCPGF